MLQMDVLIIENDDLANIMRKVSIGSDSLTPAQMMQYNAYEHIFYDSWELAWSSFLEGVLKKEVWNGWNNWFISEGRRRSRMGWENNKHNHDEKFVAFVSRHLNSQ